jgi:Ion channel
LFLLNIGWEFDSSLYFCVVTFTTIGFGDFSPQSTTGMVLLPAVSLVGLTLVAAQIWSIRNLVLEEFTLNLALQYSKTFGTGLIEDHDTESDVRPVLHRRYSDPDLRPHFKHSPLISPSFVGVEEGHALPELKLPLPAHALTNHKGKNLQRLSVTPESHDDTTLYVDNHPHLSQLANDDPTRTLTISRSAQLPSVTILAQDGLGRRHILETTKTKLYSQIFYSFVLLMAILLSSGFLFSFIEGWQVWEGSVGVNFRLVL